MRQLRIDRIELRRVVLAQIGRRQHAEQDDVDIGIGKTLKDGIEIIAGLLRRKAPQHVVPAKADDHQFRLVFLAGQREVEPVETRRGGIAGNARIGDAGVYPACA